MKLFIYSFLFITLTSCGASIKSSFLETRTAIDKNEDFAFLTEKHNVPTDAKKLGSTKFGDTGFSTDCSFTSNLVKARTIARENGANIVKIVTSKGANLLSTCNRMQVEYYYYDGDLKTLPQYTLTLD